MTDMDISIHYAFLPHTDPEASLAFYRDTLGLEVRQDVGYEGMRWITVGPPGGSGKGSYTAITLGTPDLNEVFGKLEASGAEVLQEPTDQPYGVRDCAFRDPAGNLVRINEVH